MIKGKKLKKEAPKRRPFKMRSKIFLEDYNVAEVLRPFKNQFAF
jgi:hypothetical protein